MIFDLNTKQKRWRRMDCGEVWLSGPKSECRIISAIDDYSLSFLGQPENIKWLIEDLAFSTSYDWAPLPLLPPPLPSVLLLSRLERRHTRRLRKRDNLLTEERERGWGRSQIIRRRGSLVLHHHSMLSGRATEGLHIWKNFKAMGMGIWARATVYLELIFFTNSSLKKFGAMFQRSGVFGSSPYPNKVDTK